MGFCIYMERNSMEQSDLIAKLFTWSHELHLTGLMNTEVLTVYQRLVGDLDIQKARMTALRYSRELRVQLRDENSDAYVVYLSPVHDLDRDSITTLIMIDNVLPIRSKIEKDFYYVEPKEPDSDEATTEDFEEYAKKWASWEKEREDLLNKKLVKAMDDLKAELDAKSSEELFRQAKQVRLESLCDQELKTKFIEMCTWLGTYSDKNYKQRLFPSFNEFLSQPENLKTQLLNGYAELEMSTIGLKESTKSQVSDRKSP
jgi:hypothetical protein